MVSKDQNIKSLQRGSVTRKAQNVKNQSLVVKKIQNLIGKLVTLESLTLCYRTGDD